MRDGFRLDPNDPLVGCFQEAHAAASNGRTVPLGAKPFCDDCNTFWVLANILDHARPQRQRSAYAQRMGLN